MNNIKEWYQSNFESDELGHEISDEATFSGLKSNITYVYNYIGVHDSVIRERVFSELANLMKVEYNVIYKAWLEG